jgi:hypothetical protein
MSADSAGVCHGACTYSRWEAQMGMLDHQQNAELPHPYREVFDAVLAEVDGNQKMSVTSADPDGGRITARAGMSWRSWGEAITVEVRSLVSGASQISVTSRRSWGLFDFGKNRENVERIITGTCRRLGRK